MKLISLNSWGCRITQPLLEFIQNNASSTDIFCFQEVLKDGSGRTVRDELKNGYEEIQKLLPNHTAYFSEYGEGGYYSEKSKDLDFKYGIAIYVKSSLKQSFGEGITLYDLAKKWNDYSGRFAAGAAAAVLVEDYTIVNVHGLWQGSIKNDTEAKIEQSQKILKLAEKFNGKRIICGDFNLLPTTKSIQMIESEYKNLIQEYSIKDTRGDLYTKEIRYSDYAFTDKAVSIKSFTLPNVTISDHLPLVIDFS
jgi:exonuclease III